MTQVLPTSTHLTNHLVASEEASVPSCPQHTLSPNCSRCAQGGSFPLCFPTKSRLLQLAKFYCTAAFKASNQDHLISDTLSHQQIRLKPTAFNKQAPDLVTGMSFQRQSTL